MRRHALPQSKRYADTLEETKEILRRANTIGNVVFGERSDCWLVQACHFLDDEAIVDGLTYAFDYLDPSDAEEGSKAAIYAGRVQWSAGAFDSLFERIANDETYSVIWISIERGVVFAPYDGGFDVVFPTVREAQAFQSFRPEWRSVHESGW